MKHKQRNLFVLQGLFLLGLVGMNQGAGGAGCGSKDTGEGNPASVDLASGGNAKSVDLASGCIPATCQSAGASYGMISDGCSGTLNCGSCTCKPMTQAQACGAANANCGLMGDGCGGVVDCGTCPSGQSCGIGGTPFRCGSPTCTPMTQAQACSAANTNCGLVTDGCGGIIDCGTCPTGQYCGGAPPNGCIPGICECTPLTCAQLGFNCGTFRECYCGGTLYCGTCPSGQSCGGGGTPNQCGSPTCTPRTCAQAGATCGYVGDGCGGIINYGTPPGTGPGCGTCPDGQFCGGNGPNNCGTHPCQ